MKKHSLRLTASISTLVVTLAVCLQLFLPATAHAATTSPFCNSSGIKYAWRYYSWTDNGKTNNYYAYVSYTINSSCTSVTIESAFNQLTSSRAFVSWWDHNQYANGWWGTGCPVDSTSGNTRTINSTALQAGYYFQLWLSDNGCQFGNENLVYTNLGPLTD